MAFSFMPLLRSHFAMLRASCYNVLLHFQYFNHKHKLSSDHTISIVADLSVFHKHEEIIYVYVKQQRYQDRTLRYSNCCFSPRTEGPIYLHPLCPLIEIAMDQPQCTHAEIISIPFCDQHLMIYEAMKLNILNTIEEIRNLKKKRPGKDKIIKYACKEYGLSEKDAAEILRSLESKQAILRSK